MMCKHTHSWEQIRLYNLPNYMSVECEMKLPPNLPHLIWPTSLSVQLPVLRHPRHSFSALGSCRSMALSAYINMIIKVILTVVIQNENPLFRYKSSYKIPWKNAPASSSVELYQKVKKEAASSRGKLRPGIHR